jgi:hypothetical protein
MQRPSVLAGVLSASAAVCHAQAHAHGLTFRVDAGSTTRGALSVQAGELIARIDFEEFRGFDGSLDGVQVTLQDQDVLGTPGELFDLFVYAEHAQNADFPAFAAGTLPGTTALGGALGIPGPTQLSPNSATAGAALITVSFATPLQLTVTTDLFLSVALPSAPGWPNEGLSVHAGLGSDPGFLPPLVNVYDLKGQVPVAQGSYALTHDPVAAAFSYAGARQLLLDVLTDQASGVATAVTNQTQYPVSNAAPGTASFFSGLHPDIVAPPQNAGRADNVGYVFSDPGLTPGSVIFFLADVDFAPVHNVPLGSFLAGSTGTACLPSGFQVLGLTFAAGPQASYVLAIAPGPRAILRGAAIVFDAIALDLTTSLLHGGTCVKQRY